MSNCRDFIAIFSFRLVEDSLISGAAVQRQTLLLPKWCPPRLSDAACFHNNKIENLRAILSRERTLSHCSQCPVKATAWNESTRLRNDLLCRPFKRRALCVDCDVKLLFLVDATVEQRKRAEAC